MQIATIRYYFYSFLRPPRAHHSQFICLYPVWYYAVPLFLPTSNQSGTTTAWDTDSQLSI